MTLTTLPTQSINFLTQLFELSFSCYSNKYEISKKIINFITNVVKSPSFVIFFKFINCVHDLENKAQFKIFWSWTVFTIYSGTKVPRAQEKFWKLRNL